MANSPSTTALAARIADSLQHYPPFSYLTSQNLTWLAERITVRYLAPQSIIFEQGQDPLKEFFVPEPPSPVLAGPLGSDDEVVPEPPCLPLPAWLPVRTLARCR